MKKLLFVLICILFISCESENDDVIAVKTTIGEIKQNPDYFWFATGYDSYSVRANTVENIKSNFNNFAHKIVIFAGYDCLCGTEYLKFPQFIKILDSAGINESAYEIYLMGNPEYQNPYSDLLKVGALPAFVIFRDEKPIYSLNDTLLKYEKTTDAPFYTLEEALLAGLKVEQ